MRLPRIPRSATRPGRGSGEAAVEFILVVAGFIVPMVIIAMMVIRYQRTIFWAISWFLSQPAP